MNKCGSYDASNKRAELEISKYPKQIRSAMEATWGGGIRPSPTRSMLRGTELPTSRGYSCIEKIEMTPHPRFSMEITRLIDGLHKETASLKETCVFV